MYHPSSTPRVHSLPKPTSSTPQFRLISLSTPTTLSLFAFFLTPNDAKAFSFSKDQIMTSLSQVENTIDQVEEAGSGVLEFTQRVLEVVIDALKPDVDVGLPLLKKAGDQALEIASPAFSDASKKAQEALQGSGIDTDSVAIAAKTVTGAVQQTTQAIEVAKPIASSTVETILSADPIVIAGTGGPSFFLVYSFHQSDQQSRSAFVVIKDFIVRAA